jgi:hypothetical protein
MTPSSFLVPLELLAALQISSRDSPRASHFCHSEHPVISNNRHHVQKRVSDTFDHIVSPPKLYQLWIWTLIRPPRRANGIWDLSHRLNLRRQLFSTSKLHLHILRVPALKEDPGRDKEKLLLTCLTCSIPPSNRSKVKSSAARALRQKLLETYPGFEPYIEEIMPKKASLEAVKLYALLPLPSTSNPHPRLSSTPQNYVQRCNPPAPIP